jgi:ATP-binding cassette, subfamily F, member 3
MYAVEQREIARLQQFVDRFGAQATKASAAQSRVKRIEKIEKAAAPAPVSTRAFKAKIKLAAPPLCHRDMLQLK